MPLENSYSASPYFDDYDQAKEYYKILFKPGVAVQTRELNQLQTTLQNQIERFGNHVFKSGTIISGVNFSYLPTYSYVKILDTQVDGEPSIPSAYVGYFIKSNLNLQGRIVNYEDGLESKSPDLKTLFVQYVNSSDPDPANGNTVYSAFSPSQQLTVFSKNYELFKMSVDSGGQGFSNSDSLVVMSALTITGNSIAFQQGETITQATTGAKAVINTINTTAIANTIVLSVKPRSTDLVNTSVNATAWTFTPGYNISGNISGATANVSSLIGSGAKGLITTDTLGIVQLISIQDGGSDYTFLPHVTIQSANATATYGTPALTITPVNYKTIITVANSDVNAIGTGYAFGVSEGIIYQKGYFLKVDPQVIVVDKYTTTPDNIAVGFTTPETVVTAAQDDSLYDNASNTTNYTAPGADRLQLTPTLTTLTLDEAAANVDFFALAEWKEGFPYKENRTTIYSNLADEFARRTRESQGNFVADPFRVATKEKSTANATHAQVIIDPGLAYISGYRVQTTYNNYLDIRRSTDTVTSPNQNITINYGNYVLVKELAGQFDFKAGATVSLRSAAKQYGSTMTVGTGSITAPGSEIGTARMRSLVIHSGTPGTPECVYRMYLFDINMKQGYSFRQVRAVYYDSTYDGVADVVLTYDATTASNIASLVDVQNDKMIFPVGREGVASLTDITYTYRTVSPSTLQLSTTGQLTIGPLGTGETFPYTAGGSLSAAQKQDIILFPIANTQAQSNTNGSTTTSTTSPTLTGTSTNWLTEYQAGDWVKIANTTANVVAQIKSVASNTSMTLYANAALAVTGNLVPFFPALYPIDIVRSTRTANLNAGATTLTIDINKAITPQVGAIAVYNKKKTNASPVTKTVNRELYVKIHTSNNAGGNTGPWYLGIPGVIRLKNVYLGNSSAVTTSNTDITKYFSVDVNDDENAYRSAKLILNPGAQPGVNTNTFILVKVDAFTTGGAEGFFTYGSYTINATANLTTLSANNNAGINVLEMPETVTTKGDYYDLRDVIDFRPYGSNTANIATTVAGATVNPANTFALSGDDQYFPAPDSLVSFTINYYDSRIDRVIVRKDSSFEVLEGIPHPTNPVPPKEPAGAVTLEVLKVPPYPSFPISLNADSVEFAAKRTTSTRGSVNRKMVQSSIRSITMKESIESQPRRYTMSDIGSLDRRLKAVEYTTSLNQVESAIKDLVIPSGITPTTSRFKNGFFVEPFDDYTKVDVTHPEFAATIDQQKGFLKPATKQINFEARFDTTHANTAAGIINGDTLMLPFASTILINQSIKSSVIGTDGQRTQFVGEGTVEPSSFSIMARGEVTIVPDPAPPAPDYGGAGMSGDTSGSTGGSSGSGSCFLTTATVQYLGLDDDCEELHLARYLRDVHMTSKRDDQAKKFYYVVGPIIAERKTKWDDFYSETIKPLTQLVKLGQNEQAKKLYKLATLKLIDKHATQYNDRDIVNQLYSDVTSTKGEKVPYAVKFAAVKAFLKYKIVKGSIQYNDLQNKIQKDTN
jgi:hypothetical protein